jgi:hypothetical protein
MAMTRYVGVVSVITWFLCLLGFVLAVTVDPGALNMGLGCFIAAMSVTGLYAMLRLADRK